MTPEEEARSQAYLDSLDTYVQNEDEDDEELRVSFVVPGSPRIARLIANAAQKVYDFLVKATNPYKVDRESTLAYLKTFDKLYHDFYTVKQCAEGYEKTSELAYTLDNALKSFYYNQGRKRDALREPEEYSVKALEQIDDCLYEMRKLSRSKIEALRELKNDAFDPAEAVEEE